MNPEHPGSPPDGWKQAQPTSSTYRPGALFQPEGADQPFRPEPAPVPPSDPRTAGPAAPPPNAWPGTPWTPPYPVGEPVRRGSRGRTGPVVALLAGLALAGAAGAVAANGYAKHEICSALGSRSTTGTVARGIDPPGTADLEKTADQLRRYARMLVFDGSLKSATNGLADDVDQMVELEHSVTGTNPDARTIGQVVIIAGSVNSHARQAQKACDLPVTGIFGG